MHIDICIYTYIHIYTYICVYVYIHIYIYKSKDRGTTLPVCPCLWWLGSFPFTNKRNCLATKSRAVDKRRRGSHARPNDPTHGATCFHNVSYL